MSDMGNGSSRERGGPRYVGEKSRRWPEGRPLCGAKKKREEGFCSWTAGQETEHLGIGPCGRHGGNLPSHVIAAERKQVAELAERYSVPRRVHPLEGVLEQYHRYAGQVAYLEKLVNELPPEDLFWGVESETDRGGGDGDGPGFEIKRRAGANAKLKQFDAVQHEYWRMGLDVIRVGLETAAESMKQRFGAQMGAVIQQMLVDLARVAAQRHNLSTAEESALLAAFQPVAVNAIVAFAGGPVQAITDGSAA